MAPGGGLFDVDALIGGAAVIGFGGTASLEPAACMAIARPQAQKRPCGGQGQPTLSRRRLSRPSHADVPAAICRPMRGIRCEIMAWSRRYPYPVGVFTKP